MHAVLIRNPIAGNPDLQHALDLAMREFESAGWRIDMRLTEYKGHARELAARAVKEGYPLIIVAGGDGSIGQVVDGMVQAQVSTTRLGVIPLGTGNVFARDLGLPYPTRLTPRAAVRAARIILAGDAVAMDVGVANGQAFICWAGCGIDALVTQEVETKLHFGKRRSPLKTYVEQAWRLLQEYEPTPMRIRVDDQETWEGRYYLAVVANIALYARYFIVNPTAYINDGLLDLLLIEADNLNQFLKAALKMLAPAPALQERIADSHIIRRKVRRVYIEDDPPSSYHLDGDPVGATPLDVKVLPQRLSVILDRERVRHRLQAPEAESEDKHGLL